MKPNFSLACRSFWFLEYFEWGLGNFISHEFLGQFYTHTNLETTDLLFNSCPKSVLCRHDAIYLINLLFLGV